MTEDSKQPLEQEDQELEVLYTEVATQAKAVGFNVMRYNNPYESEISELSKEVLKAFIKTFGKYCEVKGLKLYTKDIAGMKVLAVYSVEHEVELLHIYAPDEKPD